MENDRNKSIKPKAGFLKDKQNRQTSGEAHQEEKREGLAENKSQGRLEKGLNFESVLQPKHLFVDRKWKPSRL